MTENKKGAKKRKKADRKLNADDGGKKLFHSRKYNRVPLEMEVEFQREDGFVTGRSRDISSGGMYINSKQPLKGGIHTRIRFIVDKEKDIMEIDGRVAWTNEEDEYREDSHPRGMGIEFVDKDENKRKVIKEFVRDLSDLLRIMVITSKQKDN